MTNLTQSTKNLLLSLLLSGITFIVLINFLDFKQSALASFIMLMVVLWTNEGLPLAVVSLLPIVLFPSAGILTTKETTINYANSIIFLFLGGFMLAIAVEKSGLHKWIANKMLNLFPKSAKGIIFALTITSGLLSSILSNTTSALLLLPIALFLTEDRDLKMRFTLAIAYGASIGGVLTPIGTPPNLIFMGILEESKLESISFMQWIMMVAPLVGAMFVVVGSILGFGLKSKSITHDLSNPKLTIEQKKVLTILIGLVVLLFVNAPIKPYHDGLGLSEAGILLGAGLLLFMPPFSILNWMDDKDNIPYRIMFLFGAGFSIATAFSKTGLAELIAKHLVDLTSMGPLVFLILIATLVTFTTEITSNTALISIMLPILYKVSQTIGVDSRLFMMVATVCASYAFMLPIATPPNAIAMSSGAVKVKTMAKYGIILNLIGVILIVIIAKLFWAKLI